MANSAKTTIINSLISAIGAITVGATYNRTVRTCTRNVRTLPETPALDAVWVERTAEVKDARACNVTHVTLTVTLAGLVQEYGALGEAVDSLCADIEKAITTDITRGGVALDTRVVRTEEYVVESQEPLAGVVLDVEVTYRHRDGDPYTAC